MTNRGKGRDLETYEIVFVGVMAAMVYVVTLFRFPLLGSKVHFANAVCLLCGMLLGPVQGGVAAGLGSALFDATGGGYDVIQIMITFVSKFAMAFVCGMIMHRGQKGRARADRTVAASVAGALTYVALYMLKTFIYDRYVYGHPMHVAFATMGSKLPASLINAAAAVIAAPIFYHAALPALRASGLEKRLYTKE
ncbi:MAG: ECF transporter S component [Clostridia bacterium]|nr:ECF transporter S component [Clostridia bacterium]